jgi:chaperonin GroEL
VEDALHATRAAVEEGIVPGGGVAFIRSLKALEKLTLEDPDEQLGVQIIKKALEEPAKWIIQNAGLEGAVYVEKIKTEKKNVGFNAQTMEFEDLALAGVIDPTKVARIALQNAASIAGLLITTEAVVTEKPEEEKTPPMPGGGGMGDMY